jgi:hypothetical protein
MPVSFNGADLLRSAPLAIYKTDPAASIPQGAIPTSQFCTEYNTSSCRVKFKNGANVYIYGGGMLGWGHAGEKLNPAPGRLKRPFKGSRKNNFHILGARIWARFVRSQGRKTGGIASSFEDFAPLRAGKDGLKPGWIKGEIIFARALRVGWRFQVANQTTTVAAR